MPRGILLFAIGCWAAVAGALRAAPPKGLSIEQVSFAQFEDGDSISPDFLPGETVFFSFHVGGYRYVEDDSLTREMAIVYTLDVKDPAGIPLIPTRKGTLDTELVPQDKHWTPKIRETIAIPPYAPGGTYTITIYVKDKVANEDFAKDITFHVEGPKLQPADSRLEIRKVQFFRRENDAYPLTTAAYNPGDSVWIRFEIAGFKLGAGNRFEVGYGFAVLRANGEPMFAQPEAATDADHSFYPHRRIPAAFSITLQKTLKPGQYTIVLTAHDKLADQTCETKQTFAVE
jgi:hypothetical protein